MAKEPSPTLPLPGLRWRGFTLQFFLLTILPLAILMLAVVFISQSLHHQAMVQLVGDRNLRAVRAVADALSMQLDHKVYSLRTVGKLIESGESLDGANPALDLLSAEFTGGLGLYDQQDTLTAARSGGEYFAALPDGQAEFWAQVKASQESGAVLMADPQYPGGILELVGLKLSDGRILVGGFSPAPAIQQAISSILTTDQARMLVVNQAKAVLYYSGDAATLGSVDDYPGVTEALNGESGVNTIRGHHDLVTAFSYIPQAGWALVLEEDWQEIATPFLSTTQSAPLILVPLLVLALVALLFGARQIVQPLQKLEVKAASLAHGDFDAIREPVGGIAEIRHLQNALSGTAEDLESAQSALRSYIGAITDGVEKERRGLARELHDDTLQALIALNQRLQLARDSADTTEERSSIDQLRNMTEQTITNLRRMVRGLRPIYLEDLGLSAALEMLAKETSATGGLEVEYASTGEPQRLEPEVELALYRMAQEALTNARKHANAQRVQLTVDYAPEAVGLTVQDDGVGFVVPETPDEFANQGHFGLLGLTERAELIGAELKVESQPGHGTSVRVIVPQNSRLANSQ